jgi:hypothetical protein
MAFTNKATLNAVGQDVRTRVGDDSSCIVNFAGTYTGLVVTFEGTIDNVSWRRIVALRRDVVDQVSNTYTSTTSGMATWVVPCKVMEWIRVRVTSLTSGSVTIDLTTSEEELSPLGSVITRVTNTTEQAIPVMVVNSTSGSIGETGATGSTGPIGMTGPTGSVGPTGATGPSGSAGQVGSTGATGIGAQGLTGPSGAIGATGVAGPAGATGASGPAGASGATGLAGATGASGPAGIGPQGLTGPIGPTGNTGPQGPSGVAGAVGATGVSGSAGATGATGPKGITASFGTGTVPAMLLGAQSDVVVTISPAQPDATYNAFVTKSGTSLLGSSDAVVTAKTTTTVTVRVSAGIAISAGGSVSVLAIR